MDYNWDLTTPQGKQEFANWVTRSVQNEINSYSRQVLNVSNTATSTSSGTSSGGGTGGSIVPTGLILPYGGGIGVTGSTYTDLPEGWLYCNGQTISRTAYSDLFRVIGDRYGAGDGSTTFLVPDLRGRSISGKDDMGGAAAASRITSAGSGITGTTLGAVGGAQTHTLTIPQIPGHSHYTTTGTESVDHSHNYDDYYLVATNNGNQLASGSFYGRFTFSYGATTRTTTGRSAAHTHAGYTNGYMYTPGVNQNENGRAPYYGPPGGSWDRTYGTSDLAHNNMQPTLITNFIIKT